MKEKLPLTLDFDVSFDVDVQPQWVTANHTNRGFGRNQTVLDDMKHDGTALRTRH